MFLAMDGDEIAGISLCKSENELGGWVDSLGVRRLWRRKGIGLALLHHTFGEFYRRGISNVSLAVDAQSLTGATRLYERAGMHVVRQYNDYEKELRAGKELSTQSVEE
jgi:ribosomal protein S18 acetylase RimI-like enzyme